MAEETEVTGQRPKSGWQALSATISAWPLPRKIALAAVTAITIGLFAFIIIQARTAEYQLLYGNLADSDASAVVEWLKGQKHPLSTEQQRP
jgi:flagellar M-ring protein FliF